MIYVRTEAELEKIRASATLNRDIHSIVQAALAPGVKTRELSLLAHEALRRHGAESSFLEQGFPDVICISVNDEVGHGVPGDRTLQQNDLVKVDIGVKLDGFHSDCALSHFVGEPPNKDAERLVETTTDALRAGILALIKAAPISCVSRAVEQVVASAGYRVVRNAFGHGVGAELHEDPQVAHFGPAGYGPKIRPGMVLAIEPVVSSGSAKTIIGDDGWTASTIDGSLAAHVEHTVCVTPYGVHILTAADDFMDGFGSPPRRDLRWRLKNDSEDAQLIQLAKQEMDEILLQAWGRPVQPSEILEVPNAQTYVLVDSTNRVKAFCVFTFDADALYLTTLVLDKSMHGTGIANWIWRGLVRTARFNGKSAIDLCVQKTNPRAIRFYQKRGFQEIGRPMLNTIAMKCRV